MTQTSQMWRTKKVLERIMDLRGMGLNSEEIISKLNEENLNASKKPITVGILRRVEQTASIKHREFLKTDEEYAMLYKDTILQLVNEGRANIKILNDTRKLILNKLELIKKEIPDIQLMEYAREIGSMLKVQNDNIRTLNGSLERLETQQKEIKINQIQNVRLTLRTLRDLQQQGYIKINENSGIKDLLEESR